jgi:hypothetical protein
MAITTIWAFQPLPELNNETGFVACDEQLAAKLIAADKVDDLLKGGSFLREIRAAATYTTKVMVADPVVEPAPEPAPAPKKKLRFRKEVD